MDATIEQVIRSRVGALLEQPPASLRVEPLAGHASARLYVRVRSSSLRSVMVMVLPPDARASEEASKGEVPEELPFLTVQRLLEDLGVRVPAIHEVALEDGLLILEDLGDVTLESVVSGASAEARQKHYGAAIDTLAFLRREAELRPAPETLPWQRSFDFELLRWELDHFREWLLEAHAGAKLEADEQLLVEESFDAIARRLAELPRGLTHRDYQSRNLLLVQGEIAVIDFQDALQGPLVYDLVALLRDSYVELTRPEVEGLIDRYLDAYRSLGGTPPDRDELDELFDLQTVQRKLKDAGRFVFIDRVKQNDSFLPSIPASLKYAREALGRLPGYAPLHAVLGKYVPELAP
ncbi:MAG: phosphotransferase [Deltaproteobacteria bacterium]|nr:phosphotransferase [Deltaproteobacteria bacterium]